MRPRVLDRGACLADAAEAVERLAGDGGLPTARQALVQLLHEAFAAFEQRAEGRVGEDDGLAGWRARRRVGCVPARLSEAAMLAVGRREHVQWTPSALRYAMNATLRSARISGAPDPACSRRRDVECRAALKWRAKKNSHCV